MHNEKTNLLPLNRRAALVREYRFRVGVVAALLAAFLVLAAAVLLMPTYVFLTSSIRDKEARLADTQTALSSADERELSSRLAALSSDVAVLTELSKEPSVSGVVRSVLDVPRPGITVSGITYVQASGKVPSTIALSGVASTRDALRSYQLALEDTSFAREVSLPVSSYAKDADILFTITITLAP